MKGEIKVYYDNGNVFYEGDMDDRDGTIKGYYRDGSLSFEGKIKDGRKTGSWKYYDRSGAPYTKESY